MRQLIASSLLLSTLLVVPVVAQDPPAKKPAAEKPAAEKPAAKQADSPGTFRVEAEPFQILVEQSGILESSRMMEVAIKTKSAVPLSVERAVDHGRAVRKGQTLVWLETSKIDEQIQGAEQKLQLSQLSLQESEAALEEAESLTTLDLEAAERNRKRADDDLDYFVKVTRPNTEKSAKFSLDNSKHNLEYAKEELDQLKKMYEADDLTEESEELILKRAERSVESAKYFLESSQTRYNRTLDSDLPRQLVDLTEATRRQELGAIKAKTVLPITLKKRQIELEKARKQLKEAGESLAKLKRDRQALEVTAPMDGTVYYGRCTRGKWQDAARWNDKLTAGGTLTANQPFLTVVSMRPLLVRVDLTEKNLQHVRRGVRAVIQPVAFPDTKLSGQVTTLSPIPIAPGVFNCLLQIDTDSTAAHIVPGMSCKVEFHAYENKNAISVPKTAVFEEADATRKTYVLVVDKEGNSTKRYVSIGKNDGTKTEIRRGLKAGEKILLEKPEGNAE